jgi:hypothetical protein
MAFAPKKLSTSTHILKGILVILIIYTVFRKKHTNIDIKSIWIVCSILMMTILHITNTERNRAFQRD